MNDIVVAAMLAVHRARCAHANDSVIGGPSSHSFAFPTASQWSNSFDCARKGYSLAYFLECLVHWCGSQPFGVLANWAACNRRARRIAPGTKSNSVWRTGEELRDIQNNTKLHKINDEKPRETQFIIREAVLT